jgi:hypothetical protein
MEQSGEIAFILHRADGMLQQRAKILGDQDEFM